MGVTVRQKIKGRGQPWHVFIYDPGTGRRKSIKVGPQSAAEELAAKIREQMALGEVQIAPDKQIPTFGEYARKWLDSYGATHLKYSTLKSYQSVLKHHLNNFQEKPLDQITRLEIKELIYEKLKSGLAPNSVKNIKNFLSGVLSHALEDGLLIANPVSRLGKLIKTKERKADD